MILLPGTYAFPTVLVYRCRIDVLNLNMKSIFYTVIRMIRTFALLPQIFTPNLNCFGFDKKTLFFVID